MSDQQLHARDKVIEQMSRQGLVEENVTKGILENISQRQQAYDFNEGSQIESAHDREQNKSYYQYQQQNSAEAAAAPLSAEQGSPQAVPASKPPDLIMNPAELPENVISDLAGNEQEEFSSLLNRVSSAGDKSSDGSKRSSDNLPDTVDELLEHKIRRMKYERKKQTFYFSGSENRIKGGDINEDDEKDRAGDEEKKPDISKLKFNEKKQKDNRLKFDDDKEDDADEYRAGRKRNDRKESERNDSFSKKGVYYAAGSFKRKTLKEAEEEMDPEAEDLLQFSQKGMRTAFYFYNRGRLNTLGSREDIQRETGGDEGRLKEYKAQDKKQSTTDEMSSSRRSYEKSIKGKLQEGSRYLKESEKRADIKKTYQKKINRNRAIAAAQDTMRKQEFLVKAKEGVKRTAAAAKSGIAVTCGVLLAVLFLFIAIFLVIFLIVYSGKTGLSAYYSGLYQSTYSDISDCEAYFRELETELEEKISKIEEDNTYAGCDEYIYNLGSVGHNAVELMSYLATKYQDFTLEMCRDELESLFEEMYTLSIEIKEEPREREVKDADGNTVYDENGNPVKETFTARICYITLEVKEWDEIMQGRLSGGEQERYKVYKLSQGGQQIYANPLKMNWKDKISSRFGERIHPITKERSFHSGIDIAVPEGTPLYSATDGTVTESRYSETAGNCIIVEMESGYRIKYMHLNSRDVSVGDQVSKGMLIGATGNTGRSTGPHLHVEVRTPDNTAVDPTFIIANGITGEGD